MAIPKQPVPPETKTKDTNDIELNNSIDELENLISGKSGKSTGNADDNIIPVLDEVIDPDEMEVDFDEYMHLQPQSLPSQPGNIQDELDDLIGSLDERITGELDALVNILKETVKDSILTELKAQLEQNLQRPPPEKPDSD